MTVTQTDGHLLWSLSGSGLGTTLTASGNSGGWGDTPPASYPSSSISLGLVSDLALLIYVGGAPTGTTPTLAVALDVYDDQGHLFANALKTASNITAAGTVMVFGGLHGGAASSYLVLPSWGRVSWTVGGATPAFPQAEISLYGR